MRFEKGLALDEIASEFSCELEFSVYCENKQTISISFFPPTAPDYIGMHVFYKPYDLWQT